MTRTKKSPPVDTAWPPAGVRDLKPDVSVRHRADHVRFPILREALERKTAKGSITQGTPTAQVKPDTLTEPLVQDLRRRTHSSSPGTRNK